MLTALNLLEGRAALRTSVSSAIFGVSHRVPVEAFQSLGFITRLSLVFLQVALETEGFRAD